MKVLAILFTVLLTTTSAYAAGPGDILGQWKSDGGDSRLELFNCACKICGKIVWLKVPKYIDPVDGPIGKTKVDWKNPEPALRNRPIIGLQVVKGLTPRSGNRWDGGTCYDPESGRSYKCKMQLATPDRLNLRGYIGVSLLGRNFSLTR